MRVLLTPRSYANVRKQRGGKHFELLCLRDGEEGGVYKDIGRTTFRDIRVFGVGSEPPLFS